MVKRDSTIHLFAGERDYCQPGMDGYIGVCRDEFEAAKRAEREKFDWAQIVESTPDLQFKIINVGRWDAKRRAMVWQADASPVSASEFQAKTCERVLHDGINILIRLPASNRRAPLMKMANGLFREIDSGESYPADVRVYLLNQLIRKVMASLQRTSMSKEDGIKRRRWLKMAAKLLSETADIQFSKEAT